MQATDDDAGAVLVRIDLRLRDVLSLKVVADAVQVDLHADPLGVALPRGQDARALPEPGRRDVETHTEETELVVHVVARPASPYGPLQAVVRHAATRVGDHELPLGGVWEFDADAIPTCPRSPGPVDLREVVECVVDQLRDALPLVELDLTQHAQHTRGRSDLHRWTALLPRLAKTRRSKPSAGSASERGSVEPYA